MSDTEIPQTTKEIQPWRRVLQKPSDVIEDIYIPKDIINKELYVQGYWHGMHSTVLKDFRKSFREGFRRAMLERRKDNEFRASKFHSGSTSWE